MYEYAVHSWLPNTSILLLGCWPLCTIVRHQQLELLMTSQYHEDITCETRLQYVWWEMTDVSLVMSTIWPVSSHASFEGNVPARHDAFTIFIKHFIEFILKSEITDVINTYLCRQHFDLLWKFRHFDSNLLSLFETLRARSLQVRRLRSEVVSDNSLMPP